MRFFSVSLRNFFPLHFHSALFRPAQSVHIHITDITFVRYSRAESRNHISFSPNFKPVHNPVLVCIYDVFRHTDSHQKHITFHTLTFPSESPPCAALTLTTTSPKDTITYLVRLINNEFCFQHFTRKPAIKLTKVRLFLWNEVRQQNGNNKSIHCLLLCSRYF